MENLNELYRNPAVGLNSKDKFTKKLKDLGYKFTKKQIDEFFAESNPTAEIHKQQKAKWWI